MAFMVGATYCQVQGAMKEHNLGLLGRLKRDGDGMDDGRFLNLALVHILFHTNIDIIHTVIRRLLDSQFWSEIVV